ncbi:MAG: cation transporter [Chlorobiaceae bacterium]
MKNEFQVTGMSCGGCELLVREALEELDGVSAAQASHQSGVVSVEYDPQRVSVADLKTAIEAEGFKVTA